ncbi:hypothetical protein Val02_67420 [Virgisporangium aliadipatigenens]|uniref:DUF6879 domain-containing protein n=1 Tax=Virgisporangium aliadipatigenens TaxID=741659 RepID=A0A8J4DU10_9ACTN|nr:DUF6879 family protein [Virgisporangium aliadipatigenens]GIJ49856.1 hypothetical protein Val02_67420 [Virgisporangium aliadipatigenens]
MGDRPLDDDEFVGLLGTFAFTAFRLESQAEYCEPSEIDTIRRFAAGDPQDPTEVPSLRSWFAQVRRLTAAGRTVDRVRIHDEPPTVSQRWEQWAGAWNVAAGERLRYLSRRRAEAVGLLPDAGHSDWWLLDDRKLIVMRFDGLGNRVRTHLTDDPGSLGRARYWRDLALAHGVALTHAEPEQAP